METRCWSTGREKIRGAGLRVPDRGTEGPGRRGRRLAPHTSQFGHPIARLEPQPRARFRTVRRGHGGNVARRQRGRIMDKVERSFAAATAVGFVVLVIGIGLLALM